MSLLELLPGEDLNPGPVGPKPDALPNELSRPSSKEHVFAMGISDLSIFCTNFFCNEMCHNTRCGFVQFEKKRLMTGFVGKLLQ